MLSMVATKAARAHNTPMATLKSCSGLCLLLALLAPNSSSWRSTMNSAASGVGPQAATSAVNAFGLKLFSEVAGRSHENVVVSPLSVFLALAMTESGAAGSTREAMRHGLAVPGAVSEEALHQSAAALLKSLQSQKGVQLSIANALWSDARLPLATAFVERCRNLYQADATTLDLRNPEAANTINAWVRQKTQDKIPEIVKPADVIASLAVLTNAIYFKGGWDYKFDKDQTKEGDFHLAAGQPGKTRKVRFMHRDSIPGGYRSGPGFEAVALPYASSDVRLFAILPARGTSPQEALQKVRVAKLFSSYGAADVDLKLPKFTLSFAAALKPALEHMGMGPAFREGADFTPLGSSKFYVGQVLHRTRMEVDEEGTVAAAATAVTMRATAAMRPKPEKRILVFDRPFALLLCDAQTGAILFAGAIYNPE
jgi:serpin B